MLFLIVYFRILFFFKKGEMLYWDFVLLLLCYIVWSYVIVVLRVNGCACTGVRTRNKRRLECSYSMLTLFHNFQVTTYIVITVILLAAAYPPPSAKIGITPIIKWTTVVYKCFLAYFSISKIKHALPYVTDAFIVPNSYKRIGCCFYGLTKCSVLQKLD